MKIYFAGSMRGESEDREIYHALVEGLQGLGQVLTEHVGNLGLTDVGEKGLSDEEIFLRDISWIHEAHIIVAEVTLPSLGVGYELGLAESLGKPVICRFRDKVDRRLSAMIAGNPGLQVKVYQSVDEAVALVSDFMQHNVR